MTSQQDVFPVLERHSSSVDGFISAWAQFYSWDYADYDSNIREGNRLTKENVRVLLRWKAGPQWSDSADEVVDRLNVSRLNTFRRAGHVSNSDLETFFRANIRPLFKSSSIVWGIALCHFARPWDVPLYDVNVWRAWRLIVGDDPRWVLEKQPVKLSGYLEYREWFLEVFADHSPRDADMALMSFGQFASSRFGSLVCAR
jgi:hypothetical protein